MKILQIVNSKRDLLGEIFWKPSGNVNLNVTDENSRKPLQKFIETAEKQGIPLRTGQKMVLDGHDSYVDKIETIHSTDSRFLDALSDLLRRQTINGQRVFGLLKQGGEADE